MSSRPLVPHMHLGGEIAPCPPLDTTMYFGKADILMTWLDHFNKCLFPKCLRGFKWKGFGLTQRFLRCSKSADDGACLYCKFNYRLKTLGYTSKGIGSWMTKFCPIKYIDENYSKKSTWDIFKNNKNKFENPVVMVAMAITIHYML